MHLEEIREYALSLPFVTEDMPFDDSTITYRIHKKMFLVLNLDRPEWITLKCDPEKAIDLREKYSDTIQGAWHFNKKYWNMLHYSSLPSDMLVELIDHSYQEVIKKMPLKVRKELGLA